MTEPNTALDDHFQQLYRADADPWKVRQRWYEQRKRNLVMACLPDARYRHAFEPACGNGELTAALAQRAERVTASDMSAEAVRLTRARLAREQPEDASRVAVQCQRMPDGWPHGPVFDLIVISEMLYYLDENQVLAMAERCTTALAEHGTLLLCHWRRPFSDRRTDTDTAHRLFDGAPALHRIARHDEADFLLDVWSRSGRSVAQREGLA